MRHKGAVNPFYGLVVFTAMVFVVTAMGYAVSFMISVYPSTQWIDTVPEACGLLRFFQQRGDVLILSEAVVLMAMSIGAMVLDRRTSCDQQLGTIEGEGD